MSKDHESGRESFSKYRSVIKGISWLYFRIPRLFRSFISIFFVNGEGKVGATFRYIHFGGAFRRVGDAVYVGRYCVFKNSSAISVGNNVSIHEFCYMDGAGEIIIGNNVSIAHNCSLVSFEHTWSNVGIPIKYNPTKLAPVCIEDDVWLGCGVRVLSGAVIRSRVVVAAGSVVKGELESGFIYAGVPAKKIRAL